MPYNILTHFEQIWRGSSWDIMKNQDVWHGMTLDLIDINAELLVKIV